MSGPQDSAASEAQDSGPAVRPEMSTDADSPAPADDTPGQPAANAKANPTCAKSGVWRRQINMLAEKSALHFL